MGIKIYKPTSPGRRGMTGFDFSEITKTTPEKAEYDAVAMCRDMWNWQLKNPEGFDREG